MAIVKAAQLLADRGPIAGRQPFVPKKPQREVKKREAADGAKEVSFAEPEPATEDEASLAVVEESAAKAVKKPKLVSKTVCASCRC